MGLAVLALLLALSPGSSAALPEDRIWFAPSPGSIDYQQLFARPEEWPHARQLVSVFKFYQQHTQTPTPDIVGPNSYDALARAGAFRLLNKWGKKIALEVGAVKDFYCTPDASGMNAAIAATAASIRAVQAGGGSVAYLAMDDPFAAGKAAVCGGPAPEPTADRIATYVRGVRSQFPDVRVGLIEAYPTTSEPDLEKNLDLLRDRNVAPVFLHADIDSRGLRPGRDDFTRDMRALRKACADRNIAFGIIVWGYDGNSDVLYTADTGRLATEITDAFPSWNDMPDQLIFQSWAVSDTGLLITPSNLPEDAPYTHTRLLWQLYRDLRARTGPSSGVAIKRNR